MRHGNGHQPLAEQLGSELHPERIAGSWPAQERSIPSGKPLDFEMTASRCTFRKDNVMSN